MGYKERRARMIAALAAPHLEPGEQIQTGFVTVTGSGIFTVPAETFVVTDRAILVVGRGEVQRLPPDFWFGKPTGFYHKIQLDRTYKVHRQWYREVIAADEALCPRPVDTPHRRPFAAPLVARDFPADGQIPPR